MQIKLYIEIPLKGVVDCSAAKNKCIIIVQKIKSKCDSKWKKFYPVHNEIQCDHVWEKSNYATKLNIDNLIGIQKYIFWLQNNEYTILACDLSSLEIRDTLINKSIFYTLFLI